MGVDTSARARGRALSRASEGLATHDIAVWIFFLFECHFTHCTVNCKKTIYSDIKLRYQARYTETKV